jgi:hypothetical protein
VQRYSVARSCNHCDHGNATVCPIFFIVVGVDVGVSMTKVLIVAMEMQQYVPFFIVVGVDVGVSMTKVLIVAMEMQQWVFLSLVEPHISYCR